METGSAFISALPLAVDPSTPLPTSPTVEHLLQVLADNSQNSGLPPWQVVVGLLAVTATILVGALARGHDRKMRLQDDVRSELVRALEVVDKANSALRDVKTATWKLETYAMVAGWIADADPRLDEDKAREWMQEIKENLGTTYGAFDDAKATLRTEQQRLELLCPEASPLLLHFAWVVMGHEFADLHAADIRPHAADKATEDSVKELRVGLTEQIRKSNERTKKFAEVARQAVQPEPSIWEQTATTVKSNAPVIPN